VAAETLLGEPSGGVAIRCHLDFCPDNVLLDASGRPVVIDWENSGPGSADGELAMTALDFAQPDDGAAAELVAGYATAGGPGRLRGVATFATAVAVQGHLLEFYARRRLAADASGEDRARSDWRMTTLLARPVTLERIGRLLTP
jgi:aminoglycoside phosphotransferase (APT) family kinase protein